MLIYGHRKFDFTHLDVRPQFMSKTELEISFAMARPAKGFR